MLHKFLSFWGRRAWGLWTGVESDYCRNRGSRSKNMFPKGSTDSDKPRWYIFKSSTGSCPWKHCWQHSSHLRMYWCNENWRISGPTFGKCHLRMYEGGTKLTSWLAVLLQSFIMCWRKLVETNQTTHCPFDKFSLGELWSYLGGGVSAQHSFPLHTYIPQK